jgi:hypothetical protein
MSNLEKIHNLVYQCKQLGIKISLEALQDIQSEFGIDTEEIIMDILKQHKKKTFVDKLIDALEPKC